MQITVPQRQIPVRETTQVLVAGRCISADHVAESGVRAISLCTMTGQAAGTAAGLALREHTAPAGIPVPELQARLRAAGFTLLP